MRCARGWLFSGQIEPTPTADMHLDAVALDIGIATGHSTYDTLYLAFAVAICAGAVVTADGSFVQSIRSHPDARLSAMVLPLDLWAKSRGAGEP